MNTSALIDDRTWRRRRWASFGAALALIVLMIPVSQAQAEGESLGCLLVVSSDSGTGVIKPANSFNEGEVITVDVTADPGGATGATLEINDTIEDEANALPATLQYTIPSSGQYKVAVVANGVASFELSCAVGSGGGGDDGDDGDPDDPSDTLPPDGDYCESGKAFGKSVSAKANAGDTQGKDGYNAGTHQGFSSCKDG